MMSAFQAYKAFIIPVPHVVKTGLQIPVVTPDAQNTVFVVH